jgi:hypothetical protein
MPSYQDIDWGYNEKAPKTASPFALSALNTLLASIGYQMKAGDPVDYFITWEKPSAIPITLTRPQFRADGYDQLVYDRNDIVDMFLHFNGRGFPGGHEIIAKLQAAT